MYDVNLYPPVFSQPYMPAFIATGNCKVYFQLSNLNVLEDLYSSSPGVYDAIHVTVRRQSTNESALKSMYTTGIMLKQLQQEEDQETGNKRYYIEITPGDMEGNNFVLDEYYKVQLRFTSSRCEDPQNPLPYTPADIPNWLAKNQQYFSEWSIVALIRGISSPTTTILVNNTVPSDGKVYLNTDFVTTSGEVTFFGNERLNSYRIKIFSPQGELYQDTGDIISKDGTFSYIIKRVLNPNPSPNPLYDMNLYFTSVNGYKWEGLVQFRISSTSPPPSNITMNQIVENSAGRINVNIHRDDEYQSSHWATQSKEYYTFDENGSEFTLVSYSAVSEQVMHNTTSYNSSAEPESATDSIGYRGTTVRFDPYWKRMLYYDEYTGYFFEPGDKIVVRRTGSDTNFTEWEILTSFEISVEHIVDLYWYDYTAEPGIWYKYQLVIYKIRDNQVETSMLKTTTPVMLDTEDIFLNAEGQELIIKFDPTITNLTSKTAESITDTIGSKYPFIRKNGNVNYKTFSLSGTISCFMDIENNVFKGSKQDIYQDSASLYEAYNTEKNISMYNDYIYEKHFRNKVMKFLQSNSIKLFRSLTEGNMLVKLANISFTPNQTLGRMIYGFSCTAYEVAECNEINYDKYQILKDNVKTITIQEVRSYGQ